jgi:nucleotide-binding universal stress UspA family protein
MYDRLLPGTDGTVASEQVIEHAVELAAVHWATLHAVYVVDSGVYSG